MSPLPVVLLHAFPTRGALWAAQAAALTSAGHSVITPDLPGFGTSPVSPHEPNLDVFAAATLAAADAQGWDRFILGGLSMGGYSAMAVLRAAAHRVAGLVLADTRATADSEEGATNRRKGADAIETSRDTAAFATTMLPSLLGATTMTQRPDVVTTVRGWIEATDPAGIAWAQRAMAARPDSLAVLTAYAGPALIVWGEEDTLTGIADQGPMLESLSDVELVMIPDAGHLSAVESPDAVSGVLLDFVSSVA